MRVAWVAVAIGLATLPALTGCGSDGSAECGEGTQLVAGECRIVDGAVAAVDRSLQAPDAETDAASPDGGLTCGPGTREQNGQCVPTGVRYEIRSPVSSIGADGFSKVPLLLLGTLADGSYARDPVVVTLSRPGSGSLSLSFVTLSSFGQTIYFTPCSSITAGCLGPTEVRMALVAAPGVPVATRTLELVAPTGVYSPAACMVGGSVLFFDGNDYIYNGTLTVRVGTFTPTLNAASDILQIHIAPGAQTQGLWWDTEFATRRLMQPLTTQVYRDAERYPFESPGRPGITISGDGRGCNRILGHFQLHTLETSGTTVRRVLATFEQHCEAGTSVLRGCIAYEAP